MPYNSIEWTDKGLDPNISSLCLTDDQARVMLELQQDGGGLGKVTGSHWDTFRHNDRRKQRESAEKRLKELIEYANIAEDYNLEDTLSRLELPEIPKNSHSKRYKEMFQEEIVTRLEEIGTSKNRIKILKTELMKTY